MVKQCVLGPTSYKICEVKDVEYVKKSENENDK